MNEKMFDHTDAEGDRLFFNTVSRTASNPAYLVFGSEDRESQAVAVRLDGHVVRDLHAALGEWLFPGLGTEAPVFPIAPDSLIDQLVKRAVSEEVARVLPLHLAPFSIVADRCDGTACCGPHPIDAADPEPHDVGIVDEPAVVRIDTFSTGAPGAVPVTRTVHADGTVRSTAWSDALFGKAEYEPEPEHGRLMAELPRRAVHPDCPSCDHSMSLHPPAFGVDYCAQFTSGVVCGCRASTS